MRPTILSDNPYIRENRELINRIREICHAGGDTGRALYEQIPEFEHSEGPNGEWVYLKPIKDGFYEWAIPDWGK